MSQFVGMDPDQIRVVGRGLKARSDQIDQLIGSIDGLTVHMRSCWQGLDSQRFQGWWESDHKPALARLSDAIDGLGQSALNNADEQEAASGGEGHHGTHEGGSRIAGPTTPLDTKGFLIRGLETGDDGVRIDKVRGEDGKDRFVVYLNGTGSATNGLFSLQDNADAMFGNGGETEAYIRALLKVRQIDSSDEVLFVGFSQGGIHAQNLAQSGDFGNAMVITNGSPQIPGSMGDNHILRLEARGDSIVERTGGIYTVGNDIARAVGLDRGAGIDTKFVGESGIRNPWDRLAPTADIAAGMVIHEHHIGYEKIADEFDASTADDHVAFREKLSNFQGNPIVDERDV